MDVPVVQGASVTATSVYGRSRLRSPTIESILAWRQRIANKYRDQLGEELTWNERSNFERGEEVAASQIFLLLYAAAVLDKRGEKGLKDLVPRRMPADDEMNAAFKEAERRAFGGRFPQLLLGARIWLPFERNLMIEEPDWYGSMARYGSVLRFVDEVAAIRAAIANVDPSSVQSSSKPDMAEYILPAALQISAMILPIAALAKARHLPLWSG